MCGRYTLSKAEDVLRDYLGVEVADDVDLPIYNASPGQHLPVILDIQPGRIIPVLWGIKPGWAGARSSLLINARSETVNEKPTFRKSFQSRRCLVVADGFFEWQATEDGKQPFRITMKSGDPFVFAGIWQEIDGQPAYVILTTAANEVTRPIHDRMPVILEPAELEPWLSPETRVEDVQKLLNPYPEDSMKAYPVSKAVNSSRNQDAGLIDPLE
jgi:putative SOS response-associated peptidase YedK